MSSKQETNKQNKIKNTGRNAVKKMVKQSVNQRKKGTLNIRLIVQTTNSTVDDCVRCPCAIDAYLQIDSYCELCTQFLKTASTVKRELVHEKIGQIVEKRIRHLSEEQCRAYYMLNVNDNRLIDVLAKMKYDKCEYYDKQAHYDIWSESLDDLDDLPEEIDVVN